jgi:FAD binding domain/Berberine and berberine like
MKGLGSLPGGSVFVRQFKGEVITPASTSYDGARAIWNRDINRFPRAIVRPLDDEDVVAAVRFARDADLLTAVRAGGHSYQGHSTCDDGVVIDLSQMRTVKFDPAAQVVSAQGGVLLRDVDGATLPQGQVLPAGVVSHTGLAGLALGGGIGYLTPSFGMTCDQFVRLRLVTASGEIVEASETENPDLFWALRGGGGNFGIVTNFECRTHELGPVQIGPLLYPMDDADEVIAALSEVTKAGPRELSLVLALGVDPAARLGLPPGGQRMLAVLVVYRGGADDAILRVLRSCAKPAFDGIQTADFHDLQRQAEDVAPYGVGWYMKSGHARDLSPDLSRRLVDHAVDYRAVASPGVQREVYAIQSLGGAASDVVEGDTAYGGRQARWHVAIEVGFTTPDERARIVDWTKQSWAKTEQLLDLKTSYINFNFEEEQGALDKVYGPGKLSRLRAIKRAYDPDNFFRLNTNIAP